MVIEVTKSDNAFQGAVRREEAEGTALWHTNVWSLRCKRAAHKEREGDVSRDRGNPGRMNVLETKEGVS